MALVYGFPADGVVTPAYFYMVLVTTVATSFTRYTTMSPFNAPQYGAI